MAKAKLSILISRLRGSTKNISFVHSRAGNVQTIRRRFYVAPPAPPPGPGPEDECACQAFKYCDWLFQNKSKPQRQAWVDAQKKPKQTGYTVWMKECLCAVVAGNAPPDDPSPSGGYSCDSVVPGEDSPGLEICGWRPEGLCPPCDADMAEGFTFLIPFEPGCSNAGGTGLWAESMFCTPIPTWLDNTEHQVHLFQRDGYMELNYITVFPWPWCMWTYTAAGTDCMIGREFHFHSNSGTSCFGTPALPITMIPWPP